MGKKIIKHTPCIHNTYLQKVNYVKLSVEYGSYIDTKERQGAGELS